MAGRHDSCRSLSEEADLLRLLSFHHIPGGGLTNCQSFGTIPTDRSIRRNNSSYRLPAIAGFSSEEVTAEVTATADKFPDMGSNSVEFLTTALQELASCKCGENAAAKLLADPDIFPFLLGQGIEDQDKPSWAHTNHHPPVSTIRSMDLITTANGLFGGRASFSTYSTGLGLEDIGLYADWPEEVLHPASHEEEPPRQPHGPLEGIPEDSQTAITQAPPRVVGRSCSSSSGRGDVAPDVEAGDK